MGIPLRKYSIKIGRNTELIGQLKPEPDFGPFPQIRESDANLFDIMTDYNWHKVGTPQEYKQGTFVEDFYRFGYNDILVIPPKSITIDNNHIDVAITDTKDTKSKSQQPCKASIYNLREDTRDFIRVGDAIIIHGGFESDGDELPLLYVGQIESVKTLPRTGNDIITEITAKPTVLLNDIKINRSYPPGTSLGELLQDLIDIAGSKGLPLGNFERSGVYLSIMNRSYPFGIRINGKLLDALQEICSNNNYRAYVVLGKLYVHPQGYTEYRKVATITDENIIGSVEVEEDGSGSTTSKTGSDKGRGFTLSVNLNGDIDTTTIVKIRTSKVIADCKVTAVRHVMQYEGSSWATELSLSEIKHAS